jgi:uncharacterized protein (DUF2225 family)
VAGIHFFPYLAIIGNHYIKTPSDMATDSKALKSLLHESIGNIDDEELLRLAKSLLERKYTPAEKTELNEYQKQRIDKAKASIAKGDSLTNEKADELVAKWLNK